ncbi:MAG: hypothetical protein HY898_36560 [Deltaproteobacteria bacterium]|nr:hypothetical protein [Deltaproteobacteria bacterium]
MSDSKSTPSQGTKDWVRTARDLADAGDRWFVSIARGLGSAAGTAAKRARAEAAIVSDSAQKAADTTVEVTRKMVGSIKSTIPPAAPKHRRKAVLKALGSLVDEYAARINALPEDRFASWLEEITGQIAFELRTLPEPPKNDLRVGEQADEKSAAGAGATADAPADEAQHDKAPVGAKEAEIVRALESGPLAKPAEPDKSPGEGSDSDRPAADKSASNSKKER